MKTHLNLLPIVLQKQHFLRNFKQTWIRLALVSCLSGALLFLWLSEQHAATCQELERIERIVHPFTLLDDTNQKLAVESKALEQELQSLAQLEQANVPLAVLGLIGKCFRAIDRPIRLDSLRVELLTAAGNDPAKKAATATGVRILIMGTAYDDNAISAAMMQLRASGVFTSVELEASQATSQTAEDRRTFQIRCQI